MKKFFSVFSMLVVLALSFTACTESKDDPSFPTEKFKNVLFVSEAEFSEDFLKLVDVTCTYTDMSGKTTNYTPKSGKISIQDTATKLPADLKLVCTASKSKDYDTYKASKDKFDLTVTSPSRNAYWVATSGQQYICTGHESTPHKTTGLPASEVDKLITDAVKLLNFTFAGTFSMNGEKASFTEK